MRIRDTIDLENIGFTWLSVGRWYRPWGSGHLVVENLRAHAEAPVSQKPRDFILWYAGAGTDLTVPDSTPDGLKIPGEITRAPKLRSLFDRVVIPGGATLADMLVGPSVKVERKPAPKTSYYLIQIFTVLAVVLSLVLFGLAVVAGVQGMGYIIGALVVVVVCLHWWPKSEPAGYEDIAGPTGEESELTRNVLRGFGYDGLLWEVLSDLYRAMRDGDPTDFIAAVWRWKRVAAAYRYLDTVQETVDAGKLQASLARVETWLKDDDKDPALQIKRVYENADAEQKRIIKVLASSEQLIDPTVFRPLWAASRFFI